MLYGFRFFIHQFFMTEISPKKCLENAQLWPLMKTKLHHKSKIPFHTALSLSNISNISENRWIWLKIQPQKRAAKILYFYKNIFVSCNFNQDGLIKVVDLTRFQLNEPVDIFSTAFYLQQIIYSQIDLATLLSSSTYWSTPLRNILYLIFTIWIFLCWENERMSCW